MRILYKFGIVLALIVATGIIISVNATANSTTHMDGTFVKWSASSDLYTTLWPLDNDPHLDVYSTSRLAYSPYDPVDISSISARGRVWCNGVILYNGNTNTCYSSSDASVNWVNGNLPSGTYTSIGNHGFVDGGNTWYPETSDNL